MSDDLSPSQDREQRISAAEASTAATVWRLRGQRRAWSSILANAPFVLVTALIARTAPWPWALALIILATAAVSMSLYLQTMLGFWIGASAGWDEHEALFDGALTPHTDDNGRPVLNPNPGGAA